MKRIIVLSTFLLLVINTNAQTQQGYVKTKGRLGNNGSVIKGMRLSGVTITPKGQNSVLSGNNGTFTLTLSSNNYFIQEVKKQEILELQQNFQMV